MTIDEFKSIALSFEGAVETPHFDRKAYKVEGKRIYASLHEASQSANIKLSLSDQLVFSDFDKALIFPVPNKFGLQGWTTFEIGKLPQEIIQEALFSAYSDLFQNKVQKK